MREIANETLLILGLLFLLHIALHSILFRINILFNLVPSGQILLIKSTVGMNIILILGFYLIEKGHADFPARLIYLLITFNGFAYIYFHFYNMSETARRIRLLILIYENKRIAELGNFDQDYNVGIMIHMRLQRLEAMNQIGMQGERYVLRGRTLLAGAFILECWRKFLKIRK